MISLHSSVIARSSILAVSASWAAVGDSITGDGPPRTVTVPRGGTPVFSA